MKTNIKAMQSMWADNGINNFYECSKTELDARIKDYEKIVLTDETQATKFQTDYFNFEKLYF